MNCYHPDNAYVWDTWCAVEGERVHLFHLQIPLTASEEDRRVAQSLGHACSSDLIHWTQCESVLPPNGPGELDDMMAFTGCSYQLGGRNYLYYTMRSTQNEGKVQYIGLATSDDMVRWERYPGNPVLEPRGDVYIDRFNPLPNGTVDCRDMIVVDAPDGEGYYGFYAARTHGQYMWEGPAIAVARSSDLIHWQTLPEPAFKPGVFGLVEVPDVFQIGSKWYMTCLVDGYWANRAPLGQPALGTGTIYAVADRIEGPYRLQEDYVLVGGERESAGYSCRSVVFRGARHVINTERGSNTVSPPMSVFVNDKGQLRLGYDELTQGYRIATLADAANPLPIVRTSLSPNFELPSGRIWREGSEYRMQADAGWQAAWLNALCSDVEIDAELEIDGIGAGVCFGDCAVLVDTARRELVAGNLNQLSSGKVRELRQDVTGGCRMTVRVRQSRLEVYLNGVLEMQTSFDEPDSPKHPGLIIDRAECVVRNLNIYSLRQ